MGYNKRRVGEVDEQRLILTLDKDSVSALYTSLKVALGFHKGNLVQLDESMGSAENSKEAEELAEVHRITQLIIEDNEAMVEELEKFIKDHS